MASPDFSVNALFNVKGKVVLITGGGSGIGKMIAAAFAQNGAKVYIAGRKLDQLKEAAAEVNRSSAIQVRCIQANVGSRAGCEALVAEFKKNEAKLHVLVNNAGITWGGSFRDFPEEKGWDNVFNVNVKSIFYMTAGLVDLLAKGADNRDPGRVINISSTSSVDPQAESLLSADGHGTWSYQPSKAAVNHLTSTLAMKLAPQQITVNAILPGLFPSKMTAFGIKTAGEEAFVAAQPTGRFGMPSDMAGLVLWLTSPASAHVTGSHTIIDGGSRYLLASSTASTKL